MGVRMTDPRGTRAWRKLRAQVVAEEPTCQVRGPRCTGLSTTADHIIEVDLRPDLALERGNLRGACGPCNYGAGAAYGNRKHARPRFIVL